MTMGFLCVECRGTVQCSEEVAQLYLCVVIRGLVGLLDYLDDLALYGTVRCALPLDMGILYVFCALFRLPNVGQGCNGHYSLCNCSSLCANLPNDLYL